jgi:type IV pilus assembly protein PilY1
MMGHVITVLLLAAVVVVGVQTQSARAQAIISHDGMQLGINREGHLNVAGGSPSESGTTVVGFRGGAKESIASGCLCEGWGVAIAGTGITGYASVGTDGGPHNLSVLSFASDAASAVSVVNIIDPGSGLPVLRVTHDYHPYPSLPWWTFGAFEATIEIANVSGATTAGNILYRRVIDWAVEPTGSPEFVTLNAGTTPSNVAFTSDDGFETANPLVNHMNDLGGCGFSGFFECGAPDHGALFDLAFAPLAPDATLTFHAYYFVSPGQPRFHLSDLGAEVWTFSHAGPAYVCEPGDLFCDFGIGGPNFVFALNGVGAIPVVAEPATVALLAAGLLGLGAMLRRQRN